ncbi:hypothetical protein K2X85_19015, partial [bacterium]|nr:hypothetical protein [bacterium]
MLTKGKNSSKTDWSTRYGKIHQLIRIENFPEGIRAPEKVRVYRRREHYVLQAWDPAQKKTVSDRVDGDFLAALARAREIDQRILAYRRSGVASRQLRHDDLVDRYLDYMTLRANAGEVDETTVNRYASSLQHYLCFVQQHETSPKYLYAGRVDRAFALLFGGFLNNRLVARNGRSGAKTGFMTGQRYVLGVVRAMFSWAA